MVVNKWGNEDQLLFILKTITSQYGSNMSFYSCRRSINYVKHILNKYAVPAEFSFGHKLTVAPEHLGKFYRLFWDMLQPRVGHLHALEGSAPAERPADEIQRTGIYLYISKGDVSDVAERLKKFKLDWTEVGTEIRCDTVLVLEIEQTKARYALVRELTAEFQDRIKLNEQNPYETTFELHGSAVARVLRGDCDARTFDVLRPGPVKQFPRVRLPWNRQLHDVLRMVNNSTNEPQHLVILLPLSPRDESPSLARTPPRSQYSPELAYAGSK